MPASQFGKPHCYGGVHGKFMGSTLLQFVIVCELEAITYSVRRLSFFKMVIFHRVLINYRIANNGNIRDILGIWLSGGHETMRKSWLTNDQRISGMIYFWTNPKAVFFFVIAMTGQTWRWMNDLRKISMHCKAPLPGPMILLRHQE